MLKEIKEYIEKRSPGARWHSRVLKRREEYVEYLNNRFPDISLTEKIYRCVNLIEEDPICIHCGNEVKFRTYTTGYSKWCSRTCEFQYKKENGIYDVMMEKLRKTNLERYGVACTLSDKGVRAKRDVTMIERYGTVHANENEEVKKRLRNTVSNRTIEKQNDINKKTKDTCRKKYNHDHHLQSPDIRGKMVATLTERYGVDNSMKIPEVKDKAKTTMVERYGVKHPLQSAEIYDRAKNTFMENYGEIHPMKSEYVKNKSKETNMKRYGVENTFELVFTGENFDQLRDKEIFLNALKQYDYNLHKLADIFKVSEATIRRYIIKYEAEIPYIRSQYEEEMVGILDTLDVEYVRNERSILSFGELDFYFPQHNLAIEINGLIWHSEAKGKLKDYHYRKTEECNKKGIQLLHIWGDEWLERKDIVINIIKTKLGINEKTCNGRDVTIAEIPSDEKKEFLNMYHIQGNDKSSIYLGAFFNDSLVGVMTFGHSRQKDIIELTRFCSKGYVPGLASKLLLYFIKNYNPQKIISFADKRISVGALYEKLGFVIERDGEPEYMYTDFNRRYHKTNFNKTKIAKKFNVCIEGKTESELMKEQGFSKIWDCGKIRYALTVSQR